MAIALVAFIGFEEAFRCTTVQEKADATRYFSVFWFIDKQRFFQEVALC